MRSLQLDRLEQPRVTIAICNFNHAEFLEHALVSAVSQTLRCEVIVVDDGSTDDSVEVLSRWRDRVKVVLQKNGGQSSAYARAYEESSGDVVIFLDSDDYLLKDAAATVARSFDAGVAKVHFRLNVVDAAGQMLGTVIPSSLADGEVLDGMLRTGVLYASAPGSGNAYRREVLERLFPLPLDPNDLHGADLCLIYGSAFFGIVKALDEPLGCYRMHHTHNGLGHGLLFGNAEQRADALPRFLRRLRRFGAWVDERTEQKFKLPERFLDFSVLKSFFANDVLRADLAGRWRIARTEGPWLVQSIWHQPSYSLPKKLGLTVWAAFILTLPRVAAEPLARYVCNPASRRSRR